MTFTVSPHLRSSRSWIWLYNNAIDCEYSSKLCYWKSFVEKGLSKSVHDCRFVTTNFVSTKMKIHLQPMNVKGRYCLSLMILNADTYAGVILEHSFRANESHVGVNESILTIMKQIWTQMNGYFLLMNSKRRKRSTQFMSVYCFKISKSHTYIVSIDTPFKASSWKDCIWLLERSLGKTKMKSNNRMLYNLQQTQGNKTTCN